MLPLWLRVGQGVMAMKGFSAFHKALSSITKASRSDCLAHLLEESYSSAKMQSVNSTTPLQPTELFVFIFKCYWFNCFFVGLLHRKVLWSNISAWRCPWCNGYRRRKWTRLHEFKSWTRLIAFYIALILLGKVWIQLFSLQLLVNSRAD